MDVWGLHSEMTNIMLIFSILYRVMVGNISNFTTEVSCTHKAVKVLTNHDLCDFMSVFDLQFDICFGCFAQHLIMFSTFLRNILS